MPKKKKKPKPGPKGYRVELKAAKWIQKTYQCVKVLTVAKRDGSIDIVGISKEFGVVLACVAANRLPKPKDRKHLLGIPKNLHKMALRWDDKAKEPHDSSLFTLGDPLGLIGGS